MTNTDMSDLFRSDGYAVIADVISANDANDIARELAGSLGSKAGTRTLLRNAWCQVLAERLLHHPRLDNVLPADALAVQCTYFSKTIENNWLVSLHQDLSIPVAQQVDNPDCSGWSQKQGEIFVQPPVTVLEQLVAVRLHLDPCNELNGAMRVVPGSHLLGRIDAGAVLRQRAKRGEHVIPVPKGGAMLMRPLLLHASSKVAVGLPRRVLHFVYGPPELPAGLRWPARRPAPPRTV